jgi:hypothetical protein
LAHHTELDVVSALRAQEQELLQRYRTAQAESLRPPLEHWYELRSRRFTDEHTQFTKHYRAGATVASAAGAAPLSS